MRILVSIAMLFWCNSFVFGQEPDWVRGKSREYPEEFYIVGVGSGDSRQDAESRARAHIAEVFSVNIKADISVSKSETLREREGKVSGESNEVTKSRIDMGLKKTLEGTEIADVWLNPKDATYYALAVLDREKAALKMSERIRELDGEVVRLGQEADTVRGKVNKLKLMLLRRSLLSDRLSLDSDYRIVSSSGKSIQPPYSYEEENSAIIKFLQNDFVIGISGSGPDSDALTQTVTDLFTGKGFMIDPAGGKGADLIIEITTKMDPAAQPVDDWYYCRWHLKLNVFDPATRAVIMSSSESGRSGQLTPDESQRKAVFDMNKRTVSVASRLLDRLTAGEE